MLFPVTSSRRLLAIALVAIAAGSPFAIPVPWIALTRWATGTVVENPGFLTAPVDNQSWFVIYGSICVGWAAIFFCHRRDGAREVTNHRAQRLVFFTGVTWFVFTLARGVLAPYFQSMYHELFLHTAFFILFVVATLQRAESRDLTSLQITLTAGAVPLAVIALMQNAGADPLAYSQVVPGTLELLKGKQIVASTFGHPNYMGSYLAPAVIMALALALSPIGLLWRLLAGASAALSIMALIAGGTRGPLLALATGMCILFITGTRTGAYPWTVRRAWTAAAFGIACCISLATAMWMIPDLRPSFNLVDRLLAGQEVASRVFYWVVGLEMFKSAPVFGVGLGQFDSQFWWTLSRMPEIQPGGPWHFMVNSITRGVRPGAMHNDHLQVLVESGLVGALIWSGLWAAVAAWGRDQAGWDHTPSEKRLNAAFLAAFVAVAVDGMFGFPFHLPCSGTLFWVSLGLWGGWRQAIPRGSRAKSTEKSVT